MFRAPSSYHLTSSHLCFTLKETPPCHVGVVHDYQITLCKRWWIVLRAGPRSPNSNEFSKWSSDRTFALLCGRHSDPPCTHYVTLEIENGADVTSLTLIYVERCKTGLQWNLGIKTTLGTEQNHLNITVTFTCRSFPQDWRKVVLRERWFWGAAPPHLTSNWRRAATRASLQLGCLFVLTTEMAQCISLRN